MAAKNHCSKKDLKELESYLSEETKTKTKTKQNKKNPINLFN